MGSWIQLVPLESMDAPVLLWPQGLPLQGGGGEQWEVV